MKKSFFLLFLSIIISLNLFCLSKLPSGAKDFLISDEDEVAMGENFVEQIEADTINYPLYKNRPGKNQELINYIDSIGHNIAAHQDDRSTISYHFDIIDQDSIINAFAVPGGFIYIYTGLIKNARNEAEIAGVLAHEVGHITMRHGRDNLLDQYGFDFVLDLIVGDESGLRTVLDAATGIAFLKYSRDNEYQADSCSVEYLISAGYNPMGMQTFLSYLDSISSGSWGIEVFSSHPENDKRVDSVSVLIDSKPNSSELINRPIPANRAATEGWL